VELSFSIVLFKMGYTKKRFNIAGVAEISTISHCIEALADREKLHVEILVEQEIQFLPSIKVLETRFWQVI